MTNPSDAETIYQQRSEIGQLKYQLERQAADSAEVLRFWRFDPSGNPEKIAQQWYAIFSRSFSGRDLPNGKSAAQSLLKMIEPTQLRG
jgi:hypothetical protein